MEISWHPTLQLELRTLLVLLQLWCAGDRLAPKYVTVEEAEQAIARAGGGPAPVGASASAWNGSAAGLPSAALVGRHCFISSCLRFTKIIADHNCN